MVLETTWGKRWTSLSITESKYEQRTVIHKYETVIMKSIILYINLNLFKDNIHESGS